MEGGTRPDPCEKLKKWSDPFLSLPERRNESELAAEILLEGGMWFLGGERGGRDRLGEQPNKKSEECSVAA